MFTLNDSNKRRRVSKTASVPCCCVINESLNLSTPSTTTITFKKYTCRRVYVCDSLELLRSTSVRNNDSIGMVAAYSSNKDRPRLEDLKHPNTYLRHLTPTPVSWLLEFRHQLKTTSPSGCFWHRVQELGSTSFFKAFACYIWAHLHL